jgi:hypothetical protein
VVERSIGRCPSSPPASMPHQPSVQQNIPSELQLYVITLHRLFNFAMAVEGNKVHYEGISCTRESLENIWRI